MNETLAISVRQPWAWLIIHGGKDIENRTWATQYRGRVLIHASKGMTAEEYSTTKDWAACNLGVWLPEPTLLMRGGIIGSVEIVDCVRRSESRWFSGPFGLVLRNPEPLPFRACRGMLRFFSPDFGGAK